MDKKLLHQQLIVALESNSKVAITAAKQAHDTATNKESVAENKYDTFGLEASYLAQGQAKRVSECNADLNAYRTLPIVELDIYSAIEVGALIRLEDNSGSELYLFLGPSAGGLTLNIGEDEITVITPSSPLGKLLIGCSVGDEVKINIAGKEKIYNIIFIG